MAHSNGTSHGTNGYKGQPEAGNAASKLRRMLANGDDVIVAPGVYDGFSARIALEVGFECIYMVSAWW